ncbi:hypothetical protein BH23VER1_BH23VER1_37670 [soil metagenome]
MSGDRSFFAPFAVFGALAVGLALWSFQLLKEKNATAAALKQAENQLALTQQTADEKEAEIVDLQARHTEDLNAAEARLLEQIDTLKARQSQRLADAYSQFNTIIGEDNDQAATYIARLESRLRDGQEVTDAELEKLAAIGSGLNVLQHQYQRPMGEFKALESYLAGKASAQPDAPDMRFAALKRVFSKRFRDEVKGYQQNVGRLQAYQDAYTQYSQAYDRAQAGMHALGSELQKQTARLYDLIGTKKASIDDLEGFFSTTRKTIGIHRDLLEFDPVVEEPTIPDP